MQASALVTANQVGSSVKAAGTRIHATDRRGRGEFSELLGPAFNKVSSEVKWMLVAGLLLSVKRATTSPKRQFVDDR